MGMAKFETPKTPENKFVAQISLLGGTRSQNLLEALKLMDSKKKDGRSFKLGDAYTEWKKAEGEANDVVEALHGWVITGDRYGSDVEGISDLEVKRAIELLG